MGKISGLLLLYTSSVLLLSSCSSLSGGGGSEMVYQAQAPLVPLSCIAVLPAGTSVAKDETVVHAEEAQSLEQGAGYATEVLAQELQGNPKIRILSSSQMASFTTEVSGGISGTVAALGQSLNCDGVLQTTVRRYKQREGTEYSVDSPASVDFFMVLRQSTDGNILWAADFREEQESFLSNILTFTKMRKRGFKWVSAEQLMEQGIKERLNECPYLQ